MYFRSILSGTLAIFLMSAASGHAYENSGSLKSGETRAFIKGDHATVHTRETSFRKAYTTITLGPVFGFDALGTFAEKTKASPVVSSFLTVPNIILLPGAVAIMAKGEIVGAVGVGGAPGGEKDEACAAAGVAAIKARLPAAN